MNKHKIVKCTIKVDKGISRIVQYILDEYPYSIIPISSCENDNGKAFIMCVVRDYNDFDRLLGTVFSSLLYVSGFVVKYTAAPLGHSLGRSYSIRWPSKYNSSISNKLKAVI